MAVTTPTREQSKRFCFELTADETENPSKRVKYADLLTQTRKVDNTAEAEDLKADRQAFQWVISTLWRNRQMCMKTRQWLEDRINCPQASTAQVFGNVTCLKNSDATFVMQFFATQPKLSFEDLATAASKDPETHHQLMIYAFCAMLTMKLTKNMKDKELCSYFLTELLAYGGDRFSDWDPKKVLTSAGLVNWIELGCFGHKLVSTDKLGKILHRPSGHEIDVPEAYNIRVPFAISKNWSDQDACIVKDSDEFVIAKWFPKGTGPNLKILKGGTDCDAMINGAIDKLKLAKQNVVVTTPTKQIGAEAAALKRQETMKKARAALDNKNTNLSRLRTFVIEA